MHNLTADNIIVMTSYITDEENYSKLEQRVSETRLLDSIVERVAYGMKDEQRVIELVGFETMADVAKFLENPTLVQDQQLLHPYLTHDVRREIIEMHTVVKPTQRRIPTTEDIQVRYIEVPARRLLEYFEWREKTIFANVRSRDEVTGFLAYQSKVSSTPGVYFFVEYSCTNEELHAGFHSPEYKEIVKDADRYIVGGSNALHTRFYKRLYVADALLEEQTAA